MTNFEKSVRMRLRYSYKGSWTTEDLLDFTEVQYDALYHDLSKQLREYEQDSLLSEGNQLRDVTELKVTVVKGLFEEKRAARLEREEEMKRKANKQKVLEALERKQDSQYEDMSLEELQSLAESM